MNTIRSFLHHNLILKVGALLVAIIIWKMISDASSIGPPLLPEGRRVIQRVPVFVLGRPTLQGDLVLNPDAVNVTIKGPPEAVRTVTPAQITLYVDISNWSGKTPFKQEVRHSISTSGVQVDSTSPRVVEVELRP